MELKLSAALGPKWFEFLMDQDAFRFMMEIIADFPKRRRTIETDAKPPQRNTLLAACDDVQNNALPVFQEFLQAMCTDPRAAMENTGLIDRVLHAYALMAVISDDPTSLVEFRRMICPSLGPGLQEDFNAAVWEAKDKWNAPGEQQPAEVTRKEALVRWRQHEKGDRQYNTSKTSGRRDAVARAQEQIATVESGAVTPFFAASEPHYKPPDWLAILRPYSAVELAIRREEVRKLCKKRLPKHGRFVERLIFDGARQEDDPAAWNAIRQSERGMLLLQDLKTLLESRPGKLFLQ